MRLIDADLLKQNCKCTGGFKYNFMCVDLITLAQVIDNQPTAFDTEKVVEKLEEVKNKDTEIALDEAQKERCFWYAQGMNRAIEIVKGGGVNVN